MLSTKFQVNWPFISGERVKTRPKRWRPSWISDQKNFSYFLSTSHSDASYQSSHYYRPFGSGEEAKNKFSRWRPTWMSDRNNFSYFLSTSHPMLPTMFQVNWPFSSEEEINRFSRWPPSWISDRNNYGYFLSTSHPDASYQVSSQISFWFRRSK